MKVLLVAHGYPPELRGGTENLVQALARGLVARGDEVVVVAGSMEWEHGFRISRAEDADPASGRTFQVVRIHRADLYFDHWHKSVSARAARAFREILREELPDVVHVHHWIRLSRDLVTVAAREGVPAAVTLHDLWTTCLVTFRVRPGTSDFCEAALGPDPCLRCAGASPPFTPWVDAVQARMQLAAYRSDVVRELELARAVATPSRAHADAVGRFLGIDTESLELVVVSPGSTAELGPRAATPREAGRLRLAAWGHLNSLKGSDLLLEALRLMREPERITLHLIGAPADAEFDRHLHTLAGELDVRFHGSYDGPGALAGHPGTDVDAMVSGTRAHESWGLVVDEAQQLGLPCVLPRAGALAERAADAAWALLYEPGDAAALAGAWQRLLDQPEQLDSMSTASAEAARTAPSMANHVERWRELYAEIVARGAPEAPAVDWWGERLAQSFEESWDKSLLQRAPRELGLPDQG